MKKSTVVTIVVIGILAVAMFSVHLKRLGIRRTEIGLSKRLDAQTSVVETSLFEMRTSIKNIHACTDEWADKFIQTVSKQVEGRPGAAMSRPAGGMIGALTGGGGIGVSRESEALGIPQDLYMKLANAIEGKLASFKRSQDTLTDVWRAHATYCEDPILNDLWMVDLRSKIRDKPEMITSAETKKAVETKQMDEDLL